jgi:molecular chaperone DnaJ
VAREAGERGGSFGDLYVFININNHKLFQRERDNIICDVADSFYYCNSWWKD